MKRRTLLLAGIATVVGAAALIGCGGDEGAGPSGGASGYMLTVNRNPTNCGTTVPISRQSNIGAGAQVPITATAVGGYTFSGWTLSGSGTIDNAGTATTIVTVNGNVTVTANFAENGGWGNNNCTSAAACTTNTKTDTNTIKIGTQVWMTKNLNIETPSGSWCYGNSPDSCSKYGRLYDWATAMGIEEIFNSNLNGDGDLARQGVCPTGWHLPSRADWDTLAKYAGGTGTYGDDGTAGKALKSTSGWYNNGNGTDAHKFSALPGGRRYSDDSFVSAGYDGYWWTATESSDGNAYYRHMYYDFDNLLEYGIDKGNGFSVRCLRD